MMDKIINELLDIHWLRIYAVATLFLVICMVVPAVSQTILNDGVSTRLANAVDQQAPLAYVLGMITVLSMGMAGWSIKRADDKGEQINNLGELIKNQTILYNQRAAITDIDIHDALIKIANAIDVLSKRPCTMDNESVIDILRGRIARSQEEK